MIEQTTADPSADIPAEAARDILDTSAAGEAIVRGGTLRIAGYIGGLGFSVLGIALLTRHLGLVQYGEYTTVTSLVTVIGAVTDAGMAGLGTREYAVTEGKERDQLMRDLLGLRLALAIGGSILALAFAFAAGYRSALVVGTALACLGLLAMVAQTMYAVPLAATLQLGWMTSFEVARQLLTVLLMVALVLAGAPVLPFLAIAVPVNVLLASLTAWRVRAQMPLRPSLHVRGWGRVLRSTIAFAMAMAVGTIYVYTAQVLTSLVASSHQNGLFAVSFRAFIVLVLIPGMLVGAAFPLLARAARDDRERLKYALQRLLEISVILGVGAALGIVLAAPWIISVIGGPKYAAAATPLRIQGIALCVSFALATWGFALLSLREHRALIITNALAFCASCGLTLGLAPVYGARGSAFATLAGELTLATGYLIFLIRSSPELRPGVRNLLRVAAAAGPAALLGWLSGLPSAPAAICALALYAILLLVLRAVPAEVWVLVKRRTSPGALG